VPAGNTDGGQWTHEGGGINDSRVLSDASPDPIRPGAQYAARAPRGGNRPLAGRFSGTPRQEAEYQATQVRSGRAITEVQRIDPTWQPTPSLAPPQNIESAIRVERDIALEAEARLDVLNRLGIDSTSLRPNEIGRPSEGILAPGGSSMGSRNPVAGNNIATVSQAEFEQARDQLLVGARPIPTPRKVKGLWFERQDGLRFSLRLSEDHGPTIDIVRSNIPSIRDGFKVHQR